MSSPAYTGRRDPVNCPANQIVGRINFEPKYINRMFPTHGDTQAQVEALAKGLVALASVVQKINTKLDVIDERLTEIQEQLNEI